MYLCCTEAPSSLDSPPPFVVYKWCHHLVSIVMRMSALATGAVPPFPEIPWDFYCVEEVKRMNLVS